MQHDDRSAIEGLFGRLAEAESRAPARDANAEALIRERIAEQPAAPYYMAQTIVVQQHALAEAESRIGALEAELARKPSSGGIFDGLFGGGASPQPANSQSPSRGPWGARGEQTAPQQGGGFLAGAAQTAMGVAGGVLLANAIGGMLGGSEAQAAAPEQAADPASDHPVSDPLEETAGADDGAGGVFDFFGDGDFEV